MGRSLCILSLMLLITEALSAQDLAKTKTSREITIRKDTVAGKILQQQQYKFRTDTAFMMKQDTTINKLDSLIKTKKKIK